MANQDLLPLFFILLFTAVVFFYVLRARNPKLTTITIGPLFLYLVAGIIGVGQLYVMGTMVLSVCVVCYLFALRSLSGVQVTRTATTPVVRGDRVEIRVEVRNRDRLPKLFLRVRCPLPEWLQAEQDVFVIPGLWPGQKTVCRLEALARKRGCYPLAPVEVIGADPLDVFQRSVQMSAPAEVVVHPRVADAPGLELCGDDLFGTLPARRSLRPADGLDFASLRDYHPGDDLRAIDWKATARFARLIVVEFEPTQVGDLVLLLDNRTQAQRGQGEESTLEQSVAAAAGMIAAVLETGGRVRLRYLDAGGAGELTGRGGADQERFLDALARLDARDGRLETLVPADLHGSALLLITPDTGGETRTAVRQAVEAGGRITILLLDAGSEAGESAPLPADDSLRDAGAHVLRLSGLRSMRERAMRGSREVGA